ncbi:MAG TPA: hypothetical protein VJP86_11040 [Vicinamibacterales bacterium]|nr:hypothetical protein [Vicinamibacterales bacterium]
MRLLKAFCCSSLVLTMLAVQARAQDLPAPGVRAAGMSGAFTAVADDASAVYWNPAGLATGSFFSLVLDHNARDEGSATMLALGTPPLGLSYYRTATGSRASGRNSLVAHHAGATVLQSLGEHFTVGGTAKYVHGVVDGGGGSVSSNKFDVDLGVMAKGSLGRIGVSAQNLTEPSFEGRGEAVTLERRVRAGIALNVLELTMISADFDLTTAHAGTAGATVPGDFREVALGAETHPMPKLWLRGGTHWNAAGDTAAPMGSLGASYAVYGSTLADAQVTFGSNDGNRGWGVGLRFVF